MCRLMICSRFSVRFWIESRIRASSFSNRLIPARGIVGGYRTAGLQVPRFASSALLALLYLWRIYIGP